MHRRIKRYLIFIIPLFFAIFSFNNVSAARTSNTDLYKKSLLMGVKTCYQDYAKESILQKDFSDYTSIFKSGYDKTSNSGVWITTHVGNSLNTDNRADSILSCAQVFSGRGSQAKGLKDFYTIPESLTGLGYVFSHNEGAKDEASGTAESTSDQITFKISEVKDGSNNNSNKMQTIGNGISCNAEQIYHDGWIFKYWYWQITGCSGKTGISYNGEELFVLDADANDGFLLYGAGAEVFPHNGDQFAPLKYYSFSHTSEQVSLKSEFDKTSFLDMLKADVEVAANKYYSSPSVTVQSTISTPTSTDATNSNSVYVPKNKNKLTAANMLIRNLNPSFVVIWKDDDKYSLYYQYLVNMQKEYPDININQCSEEKPSSGLAFKNSPTSWCIINIPTSATAAEGETLSVFGENGLEEGTFLDVLEWFNDENNYNGVSSDTFVNAAVDDNGDLVPEDNSGEDTTTSEGDPCWNAGVESQGWLLCPTLNNLKYSASALDGVVEGWLTVDTDLYDRDSAAYTVWAYMRNFANFIMIIILLVIIFSQLTGYGINNYGVKKMLPKLIVMSILINLSFVLCELAVDLSNILGVGLRNMFGVMGQGLIEASGADASNIISSIISIIFGAAGVAGAAVPAGIQILPIVGSGNSVMVVVMIVMFLVVIFAALVLFFLALGARMIMIVLCMALSPIAFALYILPNTQQFFKKWWKIFQSALVMFPICGAISGISYLIRGMVLSNSGVQLWMWFVALVAPYLPFFLLPSLLRKAIAGLGEVGGALTTMGTRFSSGVRKGRDAIQGTERYQEALNSAKSQHAVKRAESTLNRFKGVNRENLTRAQLDRLHKAEQVIKADTAARAAARVGSYPLEEDLAIDRAQKAREAEELKAYRDQFTGASKDELRNTAQSASTWLSQPGGAQRMSALIEAMQNNGMETDIYGMLRQNDVSSMSSVMQTLATSSNKVLKAYGKAGGGRSYTDFMQNGGLQAYAKNKGQDFVNGLDDKSLTEIASQQQQSVTGNIMGTEQLVQAAAQLNDEDSLRAINTMLGTRNDITISAEQATQLKSSTRQTLLGNTNGGRTALVNAMRAVAADPQLSGKLDNKVKADYSSAFGITFP